MCMRPTIIMLCWLWVLQIMPCAAGLMCEASMRLWRANGEQTAPSAGTTSATPERGAATALTIGRCRGGRQEVLANHPPRQVSPGVDALLLVFATVDGVVLVDGLFGLSPSGSDGTAAGAHIDRAYAINTQSTQLVSSHFDRPHFRDIPEPVRSIRKDRHRPSPTVGV